jgi:hypothetical protein
MKTQTAPAPEFGINWDVSRVEADLISAICTRADTLVPGHGMKYHTLLMDITACHANGTPLDLHRLLEASPQDLAHDVFGIARHIDRETGKLTGCFLPRYAARK